jgi:hypothetical protein
MAQEDRFSRVELIESDSPPSTARAVRTEPAPFRRKGFSIVLFFKAGVEITRHNARKALPAPATPADAEAKAGAPRPLLELAAMPMSPPAPSGGNPPTSGGQVTIQLGISSATPPVDPGPPYH